MYVPNIREIWENVIYFSVHNITQKMQCCVSFLQSLVSIPRLLSNGCRETKVLFKEPERVPKHGVCIFHSHLNICPMSSIF